MMMSDIYKACRNGKIDLVRVLIETSPSKAEINRLEPNGSTALHAASYYGHANIVKVLLHEYGVSRHRKNKYGLTAYQEAPTDQIRQLFHRSNDNNNRFYSDENTQSPFEVNINEQSSESRWVQFHPTDSQIQTELFHKVLNEGPTFLPLVDWLRSAFGNDPHKKKIEKWFTVLESSIKECFAKDQKLCANACQILRNYVESRQIEYLLCLYTFHSSLCQYLAQDKDKTNCLYAPILFNLTSVMNRAYKGLSFRGLTMTEKEFADYELALNCHGSYIRTKTFCSSSADPAVAEVFIDPSTDKLKVLMVFHFDRLCSTAIILFADSSKNLQCISNFEHEQEVLILPETIFSVATIEKLPTGLRIIHLEYYNTDAVRHEMRMDRFQSYLETFFSD